jgi:glycolate oxidase iron-sulfur subunit
MQHTIPVDSLGPLGPDMARAVETCVHCGFCLPTCPTYVSMGEEMDSPRGRILLMKSALEGNIAADQSLPFVDRCLGCMACVTACPSGVEYAELLAPYRMMSEKQRARGFASTLARFLARHTLPYPDRFRWAAATGKLGVPLKPILPRPLAAMLDLLPDELPSNSSLPNVIPAEGARRARVALLIGCVQQAIAPEINRATLRVLARNGVEVVIPKGQGCCGSLMMHSGDAEGARDLARVNLRVMPRDVDAILTNAAGCGSGMKEYKLLFKGEAEEETARAFARKVKDVTEFLDELGFVPPSAESKILSPHSEAEWARFWPKSGDFGIRVAYHDACHLAHAQRITAAPRRLLRSLPNVTLIDIPEGELCCGSAGTYNIEQPELAAQIGERKARNILSVDPDLIVTGNIGCMVQIRTHLKQLGKAVPVKHTMEVLEGGV